MTESERLARQMAFCLEIDKEKQIGRQTWLSDGKRKENDAEHAWHLAMMILLLHEHADEEIDILRTVSMVLIHDLVEIYAGDTYAYDLEAAKTQAAREAAAAERLFAILPEDQGQYLHDLWREFEDWNTPEARFAHTMDNIQPTMLNHATDGRMWEQRGIRLSQILNRNARTAEGSEKLWRYSLENWIMPNVERGRVIRDTEKSDEE